MLPYMSKFLKGFTEKLSSIKGKVGKKSQMALVGVLVIIMLIIFFRGIGGSTEAESSKSITETPKIESDYVTNLETRLESIVSSIKGIGKVQAFVMTETSVETIYATDEDQDTSEGESASTSEIVFSKDGSTSMPVVKLEIYPEITGILIVAEGAGDEKLRLMVLNAVCVALDIENSKIEVLEGKAQ